MEEMRVDEATMRPRWEAEQNVLKEQLVTRDSVPWSVSEGLNYVGGVDISFVKDSDTEAVASLVVLSFPQLEVVYEKMQLVSLSLPYIPGFLAFREVSHLKVLIDELRENDPEYMPQVVLVDGNGVLHPRGFGLASHLGVICNIPTIGVGKKLMCVDGLTREEVEMQCDTQLVERKSSFPLVGQSGRVWGEAVHTAQSTRKAIYVSIGHLVSLATSVDVVKACALHRVPEPIRQADLRSRDYVRQMK